MFKWIYERNNLFYICIAVITVDIVYRAVFLIVQEPTYLG